MSAPDGGSPGGRVYFVQAGEGGPIKIGWTGGSLRARMASLQTGNPEVLRLLASSPGTPEDERALHERFAAHRMAGEWFRAAPEIVAFVAGVAWTERGRESPATPEDDCPFSPEQVEFLRGFVDVVTAQQDADDILCELEVLSEGVPGIATIPRRLANAGGRASGTLGWALFSTENDDEAYVAGARAASISEDDARQMADGLGRIMQAHREARRQARARDRGEVVQ